MNFRNIKMKGRILPEIIRQMPSTLYLHFVIIVLLYIYFNIIYIIQCSLRINHCLLGSHDAAIVLLWLSCFFFLCFLYHIRFRLRDIRITVYVLGA